MNAQLISTFAERAVHEPVYPDERFPPSVYYRFLRLLATAKRPRLSVELGVCGGGGSFHLLLGWEGGRVVGIDIANDHPENIAWMLANFPNFQFWKMDSVDASDLFVMAHEKIDILFIDSVHTYEHASMEFEAYHPVLADNAVVVLDDLFRPGLERLWQELPGDKIRLDRMHESGSPTDGGFGVVLL